MDAGLMVKIDGGMRRLVIRYIRTVNEVYGMMDSPRRLVPDPVTLVVYRSGASVAWNLLALSAMLLLPYVL